MARKFKEGDLVKIDHAYFFNPGSRRLVGIFLSSRITDNCKIQYILYVNGEVMRVRYPTIVRHV